MYFTYMWNLKKQNKTKPKKKPLPVDTGNTLVVARAKEWMVDKMGEEG